MIAALNNILAKVADVISAITGIHVPPLQLPTGGGGGGGGSTGGSGGSGGGGDSPSCFVAGTLITLWDGTLKPIEQMAVGDVVRAFDACSEVSDDVTAVWVHEAREYYAVTIATGAVLHVTGEHPIYAPRITRDVERVHRRFRAREGFARGRPG